MLFVEGLERLKVRMLEVLEKLEVSLTLPGRMIID
jgi:hypothetical protein